MAPIQVVAVCLRFLAIVWLLYALNNAYGALSYLGLQGGVPGSRWVVWIQAALQLVVCGALWFFPVTIASKLLPSYSRPPDPQNPPHLHEWQTLGVICIGLWALSRAVPDLVYWITYMGMAFEGDSPVGSLRRIRRQASSPRWWRSLLGFGLCWERRVRPRCSLRSERQVSRSEALTTRWSGRVKDKVPSSYVGVRAAQLNR